MADERITNTLLTTTPTIAHTVSGGQIASIVRLEFLNFDTSNRAITVWFVPSAESTGNQHKVLAQSGTSVLQPGKPLVFLVQAHLQAGDKILWAADVSNQVRAGGSIKEVTKNGHENIPAQYLGTSLAELHAITAGFASTVISLILCNQSGSAAGAEIQVIPSGQSAANKHKHLDEADTLAPGETRIFRWPNKFEAPLTSIQGKASAATSIVVAGGIFEEST